MAHGLRCSTHVGSSWTRDQTHVPCIGRQVLNHCATREVPILPNFFFFFFFLIYLFIYFWLCWVFASARGPSPAAASGGHPSPRRAGPPPSRPPPLRSTGSRCAGSVFVAHVPSCSAARGILPDQGPNPRPPHWQADSQPLRHQGSPLPNFYMRCPQA